MNIPNVSPIAPNSTVPMLPTQQPIAMQQPGYVQQPQPVVIQHPGYVQQPQPVVMPQPEYVQQPQPIYNGQVPPPPSYQQSVGFSQQTEPVNEKGGNNVNNQPQQVVVMVTPNQIPRVSTKMLCPYCNKTVDTKISFEDNALVWGLCVILFIFTLLCCIPFCIDDLKDVVHYCPICRREIARRERLA